MKTDNSLSLLGILLVFVTAVPSLGGSASAEWHEPAAKIRFRIEKDNDQSLIPAISLLDVQPDKKSESVWKWIQKSRWKENRSVNGKRHINTLPTWSSKPIIYNLNRNIGRFVARGVVTDRADPNTSVRFEVQNDRRTLFRSPPVTVARPLTEINVAIPPGSKQLKLVTQSRDKKYYSWARWVDPGFVLRRQYPEVSSVRIYAPGYDLDNLVPAVRASSDGSKISSRVLSVGRGGRPMEILLDTSQASGSLLVYLVPSSRAGGSASAWEPKTGLVLETKWSRKGFGAKDRLPEFSKAFSGIPESVGRSLVDDIQHNFPIHRVPDYDGAIQPKKGGYGLYRYSGFFQVARAGTYTFTTTSNWDSYLAVNDKLVIGWPGKHGTGGSRGYKKGTVSLTPGVHKLEYYNYSPWGKMYCLAAWKKPEEKIRLMSRTDFLAVGRYKPTLARLDDPEKTYVGFEWSAIDEFRTAQTGRSFVTMRFDALAPAGSDHSYRWTFDDGTSAEGRTVEHVFLRQGLRKVQLTVRAEDKVLGRSSHDVYVHCRWDKTLQNLNNADSYGEIIRTRNFDKVPADDIINLSILADKAERPDWKTIATAALVKNVARLVRESDDAGFMFDFGRHIQSAKLGEHGRALELFRQMAARTNLGKSVTDRAKVHQAEILVKYFGKYDEALKTLGRQGAGGSGRGEVGRRAVLARAGALLGLEKATQATELVRRLAGASAGSVDVKREVKHSGLIRHARLLAETHQDDPNQLDHASEMIETIIDEDASKVFSPNVNLVALDVHLARKEFEPALYLAERLGHLQLNDYDRAEILTRHVVASCGLKDLDRARTGYARLSKDFPYSPAVSQAKKAIMETFGRQ